MKEKKDPLELPQEHSSSGVLQEYPADEIQQKYPTETLLKSKNFVTYQPDFARAVLTQKEYTKAEAIHALEAFFKGSET